MTTPTDTTRSASVPSRREVVDRAIAAHRAVAVAQAEKSAALAVALDYALAHGESDADMGVRDISAEIALEIRVSDRTVQAQMFTASHLIRDFPATCEAWADGRIDHRHVQEVSNAGTSLTDPTLRAEFEEQALVFAETEPANTLRPIVEALAERMNPNALEERHDRALKGRRVRIYDKPDAMSDLVTTLPSVDAHAILNRADAIAHTVLKTRDEDDTRTLDQIRADVVRDLLLNGDPTETDTTGHEITASVHITIPVLTALGQSKEPAILQGCGPFPIHVATRLAGTASGWDRVMTSPYTGCVMAVDRYKPSKEMRRYLVARDEHCRFPGCRRPAMTCECDHTKAYSEGGKTCICNLECLCKRHHSLKHSAGWSLEQLGNGRLRWGTPTGKLYENDPPGVVRFFPEFSSGSPPGTSRNAPPGAPPDGSPTWFEPPLASEDDPPF